MDKKVRKFTPDGNARYVGELWFFLALLIISLTACALINTYPFATISADTLAGYPPWIRPFVPPSNPYRYWYPLCLVGVPLGTFALWRLICRVSGVRVQKQSLEARQIYRPLEIPPLSTTLVIWGLALLLTNFAYSSGYVFFVNFHHFNYVTGPINDLLNGKVLLVDSKTQYGFLNIFLASWVFKLFLYFSHPNFHLLSMFLTLVEYASYYLILRSLCRSTAWAIVGIIVTMSAHYYGVYPDLFPSEMPVWPGNVWRFAAASVASFTILYWLNSRSRFSFVVSQLSVVVAFFWQMESGICLLGAYLACLVADALVVRDGDVSTPQTKVKVLVGRLLSLVILGLGLVGAYTLYAHAVTGKLPDWSLLTYYTKIFNNGLLQGPHIPSQLRWYWPIAVYSVVFISLFGRVYLRWNLPAANFSYLIFMVVYGFGIFRYYLGYGEFNWRPVAIVVPACILMVYCIQCLFEAFRRANGRAKLVMGAPLFLVAAPALAYHVYHFSEWTYKLYAQRMTNVREWSVPNYNVPERNRLIAFEATTPSIPFAALRETIENIKRYVPETKPIALLAYHDHSILMQSNRVNVADSWYLGYDIYSQADIQKVAALFRSQPDYLFVEKNVLKLAPEHLNCREGASPESALLEIFTRVRSAYRYEADIGLLYVYKRIKGGA